MPEHKVVVIEVPGPTPTSPPEYRVRPGSVILGTGDHLRITNYTSQTPLTVQVPPGTPAPLGHAVALPNGPGGRERIKIGPPHAAEGSFEYRVFVDTHEAHGESAPHVIIDP